MRIVTYNLRFDSIPDKTTLRESLDILNTADPLQEPAYLNTHAEQPWSIRRIRIAEHLLSEGIVLAGLQEALIRQVHDLAQLFGKDWSWIGVGRDDGIEAGEFSPIFYKHTELTLVSHDSFWLSNTPFQPSKYPGAGSYRVCTVAQFATISSSIETPSQKTFTLLNTHLDDQSDQQRRLAASLLLTRSRYEAAITNAPVFITGDFNSTSNGSDSGAYKIITGASRPVSIDAAFAAKFSLPNNDIPNFRLLDLRAESPRRSLSANFATFTGFTAPHNSSLWSRIDFVFGGSNMGWTVKAFKVDAVRADDGILASDHRPVFADVLL